MAETRTYSRRPTGCRPHISRATVRDMRFAVPLTVPVEIDRATGTALPGQLADRLCDAMRTGCLPPGARLPSTRTLAAALGVSRGVVAASYDLLTAQGRVHAVPGSGTYVSGHAVTKPTAPPPADETDLSPGLLCQEAFPPAAWRSAWRHAAGAPPPPLADPRGAPELRHALAVHLLSAHGIRLDGRALLITTGREAGLRIAPNALTFDGTEAHPGPPDRCVAGDFSGLFGPTLRVGYAVVPPPALAVEQPPHVAQLAVARLLAGGTVASTMRRRIRVLTGKRSIVDELLAGLPLEHKELGTVEVAGKMIGYGHLPDRDLRATLTALRRQLRAAGSGWGRAVTRRSIAADTIPSSSTAIGRISVARVASVRPA